MERAPNVATLAADFTPIDLAEMAEVALLRRMEMKFVLHERRLPDILPALFASYRVLDIGGTRLNHYRTLYFDTPAFALYRRHHAGGRNRYKVRSRHYVDTDQSFLEVKHKIRANETVKQRILTDEFVSTPTAEGTGFLATIVPQYAADLEPKLWTECSRVTLVNVHNSERVTLDLNLQFRLNDRAIVLPGVAVAEVKQARLNPDSPFVRLMRACGYRPTGFSKYCSAVSLLYPEVKHNRFRPALLMLSRIIQGELDVY